MDAFEAVVETLLRREGYWTRRCVKVALTKQEKVKIGRASTPRWEIDIVAYRPGDNRLLAVECKSFLDSTGVKFRDGGLQPPQRYKLFADPSLRRVVLDRLVKDYVEAGTVLPDAKATLCLAVGKFASGTSREDLQRHADKDGWTLYDSEWLCEGIRALATQGYENDVAHIVAKILTRSAKQ